MVQLKVSYEDQRDGITVVRVDSDGQGVVLDLNSAPELRAALVQLGEEGRLVLVVDLSGVDRIDGKGLGVLVGGLKRVHPRGGTLSLVVTSEQVGKALTVTGLSRVFAIHDTVPSAVEKLVKDYTDESVEQRRAAYEERARERLAREAREQVAWEARERVDWEALGAATRVVLSHGFSYEHLTESISLVKVERDLDVYTAPFMRNVLVDLVKQGRSFLVVDLTTAELLDSTGVGVLVGVLKRVRAQGGALALVVQSERLLKGFRVTGLIRVFSIFPTAHQAIEFLGREGLRAHA